MEVGRIDVSLGLDDSELLLVVVDLEVGRSREDVGEDVRLDPVAEGIEVLGMRVELEVVLVKTSVSLTVS